MLHAKRPDVGELLQCSGPRGSMFTRNAWSFSQLLQEVIYVFHPLFCQSETKIRNESMQRYIAKRTVGWTSHDHQQVHSVVLCIVLWWVFLFFCFIQNYIRIDKNIYVCCICSRYMYQSYTNKMCITCILSTCRLKKIVNCYDTTFVYIFHHL